MRRRRRYATLLQAEADDPLGSVANLFDVAMVFAVALMVASAAAHAPRDRVDPTDAVERFLETGRRSVGEGHRLGMAYRLNDGRIVYVPE